FFLKSDGPCCPCCRRRAGLEPQPLQGVCASNVYYGQCLEDIHVDVPDEDLKPKPYSTKSTTKQSVEVRDFVPGSQRHRPVQS
ncbi:unnamed protein product, partial [Symbiodinium pilosum]